MSPNTLSTAIKAKGMPAVSHRLQRITQRYGLSPGMMKNSLELFASILQEYHACASFPITAVTLERYPHIIQPYLGSHIEFCIHGYTHNDVSLLPQPHIEAHIRKAMQVFKDRGVPAQGYRSPYLSRSPSLQAALETAGFAFTSNQPILWDTVNPGSLAARQLAGFESALSFYQPWLAAECASLPRLLHSLVEIPVSLPDDEILFDRLGFSPSQVQAAWLDILQQSYIRGELFTLQLHPERVGLCASILPALFDKMHDLRPGVWCARLGEIATWWKALSAAQIDISELPADQYRISAHCPGAASLLVRAVETDVPVSPFLMTTRWSTQLILSSVRLSVLSSASLLVLPPILPASFASRAW